jgi:putative transposase
MNGAFPLLESPLKLVKSVDIWYKVSMDYQHERHCVHLVVSHMIWRPKRRRKVLVGPVKERLEQIIPEGVDEHNWQIVELALQPDHVPVFVRSHLYTLPSDSPRRLKGRSSRFLRDAFPPLLKMPSLWTHAYVLSTAGNVSSETIQKDIERQSKA